jgi:hypothetical protein
LSIHCAKVDTPLAAGRPDVKAANKTDRRNDTLKACSEWFSRDFGPEQQLLQQIRQSLANGAQIDSIPQLNIDFDSSYSWVSITLFQEGTKPLRWISKRATLLETLDRIISKLSEKPRLGNFDVSDPYRCRIMLEIVTGEQPLDIEKLSPYRIDPNRYEPGITGFKLEYEARSYLYMPTHAVVYSHLLPKHALNFLSKKIGVAKTTQKISERIRLMRELPIQWSTITSEAFITHGEDIIPLYRGYPLPAEFSRQRIFEMAKRSVDWIYDNMTEDGRFLYYYDGVKDSVIDHVHPNRSEQDNYYNILRHSGGIITLLRMYEATRDIRYTAAAETAIKFLIKHLREHTYNDQKAYYVYFNKKAKLGGTGVALAALLRFHQITTSTKYNEYIFGMAQHLLSRIDSDGEMIGYYIHPQFDNGRPLLAPTPEQKKQLFSFYYPGEALMGLALFEREMDLAAEYKQEVRKAAKKALDFLIHVRPVEYADLFEPLPSDGWLMQAIEEWSYDQEFQKKEYLDFVFNDARQMIAHMYTEENALYCDYPGAFYYRYGDHAYVDGARAEGLIAAFYLAKRMGNDDLAQFLLENCRTVAESLMYTYNSPESTFMHRFPDKSIGSFRFKLTRQWVRVDSVQHTACFFFRLHSAMAPGTGAIAQESRWGQDTIVPNGKIVYGQ